ncbi:MAG: SRPBCC family protein [Armatimonadetes bacterium]|nr:SRPBCC family protein [Armatimonadota bacterium]
MPYVKKSLLIKGKSQDIYELTKKMEEYPKFMRDVESVKVLERKNNSTITEWITNVDGTPIIWKELDNFDDENKIIKYKLIEGDLDKFEGEWTFEENQEGTLVSLGVDFDFGIPSLTELIGPTLKLKVEENSQMMLEGLKQKIEGTK